MKKLLSFLGLMLLGTSFCHADLFDLSKSKEYTIHYATLSVAGFSGTTNYILIDLSDTVNWPHDKTGEIHITDVYMNIDKAAASTSEVRLGVVNFVNESTGSVTWFDRYANNLNVSNTPGSIFKSYQDNGINTRVKPSSTPNTDGSTPQILSSQKTSGSTDFQNDVGIYTILGTQVFPQRGDIILQITKSGAVIDYEMVIRYYSMP
jgi:hypothetical protein